MRKLFPLFVCIFMLSYSCTSGITKNEVFKNDKIDPKIKAIMSGMNKHAYNSMCDNSYGALSQDFSDSLLNRINTDFAKKFMPQIQKVIKGKTFRVFDEFYIKHVKPIDTANISSIAYGTAYTIKYLTGNNETYISMLIAGDSINEVMLTFVYVNIDGKWKLNNVLGEDYSLNGKNGIEQYTYAMSLYKRGYLVDAINTLALANHCFSPGGDMFQYSKKQEISAFSDSLVKEVKIKYPIPYPITDISTKPMMVDIHYEVMDGHFTPMIVYQSTIPVSDSITLKKENDDMQKNIGTTFYGIDKANRNILYRAYNELPKDASSNPPYYGFIQKIK